VTRTWALFLLTAGLIVYGGIQLSRYGDMLAEKTGLGRTWIGTILLAATTSLPELFTGLSAVTVAGAPEIAVGDVLGSCMFNLLIISMMDAVGGRVPLTARAQPGHALSLGFGSLLAGILALSLLAAPRLPVLGWIGLSTPLVILVYLVAARVLFAYERRHPTPAGLTESPGPRYAHVPLRTAIVRFAINAVVVVLAAVFLPGIGADIARQTGMGQGFVGTFIVAVSTSLPEVVVSLGAIRLGAIDLAVGNVLGSNLFNILILALDDVAYLPGSLYGAVDPAHLVSAVAVLTMNAILLVGLTYQALQKRLVLSWDTLGILLVYFLAMMLYGPG